MNKLKIVIALPGDNNYLREQVAVAKGTAERLGLELQVRNADSDPILQSQQLLELLQSKSAPRPDGFLVEPVSATGLPRVAEAAVAAGIAWVISNAKMDYTKELRRTAKVPVFTVSQDHLEIGRIQGRQIGVLLPKGGSLLYLRGPTSNFLATQRIQGMESAIPKNVQVKTLKIQWTGESAYNSVMSWLGLSTVRAVDTQMISSQNTDFILAARKAFQTNTQEPERTKWLTLPCTAAGTISQIKPLVDTGVLHAAVVTSLTMDTALELLVRALKNGSQPVEHTTVEASSYPSMEELTKKQR
jgi:ABC-type sugar transport system substrate-binding protein